MKINFPLELTDQPIGFDEDGVAWIDRVKAMLTPFFAPPSCRHHHSQEERPRTPQDRFAKGSLAPLEFVSMAGNISKTTIRYMLRSSCEGFAAMTADVFCAPTVS
jgi:hypothetical protein